MQDPQTPQLAEADVEAALISLISARLASAGVARCTVTGSWSQVPGGEVKGEERPADEIAVAVAVGAPQWDAYLSPVCTIPAAIAITVRREVAPTGAALAAAVAPVAAMLNNLQADVTAVDDLSTATFTADGVRVDGGEPPAFMPQANVWRVARSLSIRGIIAAKEEETPTT